MSTELEKERKEKVDILLQDCIPERSEIPWFKMVKGKEKMEIFWWLNEDFTKEDYQKREIALPLMKQAYGEGKKAKFTKGQLIIDGEVVELEPIY